MTDARFITLAHNLVNYSCHVQAGEKVLIETNGFEVPLTTALIEAVYEAGGLPFVNSIEPKIQRALIKGNTQQQLELQAKWECARMRDMDAYIGIRSADNSFELANLPQEKMDLFNKYYSHPLHHGIRVADTKWVVLRYPNDAMAQLASMPTELFADHYFQVCNLDYQKMSAAMRPLGDLMTRTNDVRLVGPNLDLSFSIKGIEAVLCDGKCNIPDGEVYTAPVRDSINGQITYNLPSNCQGTTFTDVRFEFEKGKIVRATAAGNEKKLNAILDSDEGARYIGEFAIGVNPFVTKPILDTLFDEKICGSFHLTPGACYDDAYNGNSSVIHWDLVHNQTAEYGGGEIYFDGRLIRKDGLFVLPELLALNPENFR